MRTRRSDGSGGGLPRGVAAPRRLRPVRRFGARLVAVTVAVTAALVTPTPAAATTAGFVSDGFSTPALGAHWQVVRAQGVGSAEVVDGALELSVPAGVNHDPWETNESVRVVQAVADADLSVEARFESIPVARYQMQGLTVVQGDDDFLRYEVHHDGSGLRLFAATTVGGSPQTRVDRPLSDLTRVHLRLERSGDQWTLLWSPDGAAWSTGGSFSHPMAVGQVGPFVANFDNRGDPPAYTARVDYVIDTAAGVPESPSDTTPPGIDEVSVGAGATAAYLTWSTDEPASGVVEYGPTDAYGATSQTSTLGTAHQVTLEGLAADTTYHYRVVATDAAGNTAVTGDATFTTEPEPDPEPEPGDGLVSDEFAQPTLGSHWQVVRARDVGTAEVVDGALELSVPAGVNHDPWEANESVRVVQAVADADLSVEARFGSMPTVGHQMQGLTAVQGDEDFLRYEVHHNGSGLRLFAATTEAGVPRTRINQSLPALDQVYLRLERSGDHWTLSWSGDGVTWVTGGSFTHPMAVGQVGPFVGNFDNRGDPPAFTARVDHVARPGEVDPPSEPEPEPEPEPSPDPDPSPEPSPDPDPSPEPSPDPEPESGDGLVSDEFAQPTLGSHWQVVRARDVGTAEVVDGALELSVPAGVNHDPWEANESVRVVQAVADADLSVEARFGSMPTVGHQMQGLTAVQGDEDFLRYEVHHNGSGLRLFASTTVGGSPQTWVNQSLPALDQVYLRLERSGDHWTLSWSGDGVTWVTGGSFTHPMAVGQVGPFVGNFDNRGDPPAFTARVDYVAGAGKVPPEDPAEDPADPPGDPADTTAPVISDLSVTASATAAQLEWRTDEPATGLVEYGPTDEYGSTVATSAPGSDHLVTLSGLTPDTSYHYRVVATDSADNSATATGTFRTGVADGGPTVDLWYGSNLAFGPPTRAQEWVNIPGNVSDPDGVASLTYSLGDGPPRPLSVGPDQRRLQWPGDFNLDIPVDDLVDGDNLVTITATDTGGATTVRTVTVEWRSGAGAALPYTLDWDPALPVTEQAQVVDGKWTTTPAGLRTAITGYDRLVAVGDVAWTDYELTVPITVHALGPAAYTFLSGAPVIGVGLRWNGHTAVDDRQPAWGWYPTGAFAWYRFYENGGRFVLSGNDGSPARYTTPSFTIGSTYLLKVRVRTLGDGVTRYQVKLWPAGETEPTGWRSTIDEDAGPAAGSVVLIAHQLDGTFGRVEITPL